MPAMTHKRPDRAMGPSAAGNANIWSAILARKAAGPGSSEVWAPTRTPDGGFSKRENPRGVTPGVGLGPIAGVCDGTVTRHGRRDPDPLGHRAGRPNRGRATLPAGLP